MFVLTPRLLQGIHLLPRPQTRISFLRFHLKDWCQAYRNLRSLATLVRVTERTVATAVATKVDGLSVS